MNGETRFAIWTAFNKVRAHIVHNVCWVLDSIDKWRTHSSLIRAAKPYTRKPMIKNKQAVKPCSIIWNGM